MEVTFTINGKLHTLSRSDVERAVKGVEPDAVRSHVVLVNGAEFPPKQPFALATGLDRLDFTTNQARTQLRKLGFEVYRAGQGS